MTDQRTDGLDAHDAASSSVVAVIGDVGGHSHELRRLLEDLGVNFDISPSHRPAGLAWEDVDVDWPTGLTVVSVGDLIHRGPDSLGVLVLINRLLEAGHWRQVVGNHEQLYVDRPVFGWNETLEEHGQQLLNAWWADGRMMPGVAVLDGAGEQHLVTHGGLTAGFWAYVLDHPATAEDAAKRLAAAGEDGSLWRPGLMLGYNQDLAAGPVWAEAAGEVLASWVSSGPGMPAPFHQVHGHSSSFDWLRNEWRYDIDQQLARVPYVSLDADHAKRHVVATVCGSRIVGIDPCHLVAPAPVWSPLLLEGARVL